MTERRLHLWQCIVVGALFCLGAEAIFRQAYGVASPLRGLLVIPFVYAAGIVARRTLRSALGFAETCVLGTLALAGAYLALGAAGWTRWFFVACLAFAFAALSWEGRARIVRRLRRRVSVGDVVLTLLTLAMCARTARFADRLPLDRPYPSDFAWVDTPFWLTLGYAVERGFPPPDPLFASERLGYHFGCGVPIAMVRGLTGLPMHVAYFVTCVLALAVLPLLVFRILRVSWPAGSARSTRALAWPLAFACIAASQHFVWAFPSMCALPLLAFAVLRAMAIRTWRDVVPLVLVMGALVLTKEVHYVFATCLGGAAALHALVIRRQWMPALGLGVALAIAQPLHRLLVSPHRKVSLVPFTEHLNLGWLADEIVREHGAAQSPPGAAILWIAIGAAAAASCLDGDGFDRRRGVWALGATTMTYCVGFLLSVGVKPAFDPPMDGPSYAWLLLDMTQFETAARTVLALALLLFVLAKSRRPGGSRRPIVAFTAILFVYPWIHYWKIAPGPPPDPVVEALARIDPKTAVIATSHLNGNQENPHWAAFFGHRFVQLRRGRWATASPRFAETVRDHDIVLTTNSRTDALAAIRRTGTTHVLLGKDRPPVPWLQGEAPTVETTLFVAYDVRAMR